MLQTQNPYSPERINALTSTLAEMTPQGRQAYAAQHKDDPAVIAVALNVNNILNAADRSKAMQMGMGAKPTVVDQKIAGMAPPVAMTRLPEEQGIGALPTPNIKGLADGGIAGYDDGGATEGGGPASQLAFNNEPVMRMAEGGMKKLSGADLFEAALDMEGVQDPIERAFLKSIHGQESGGKADSKDSNRGAKGAMQVMPDTFKAVADPDMDINKPLDNMRAGIRYGRQGFSAAKGDPVLAGAYYYGGPGGMQKAAKGVAVSDPKNPNNPTTIGYGKSVAQRMTDLLPIGSAQAAERPVAKPTAAPARPTTGIGGVAAPQEGDTGIGGLSSLLSGAGAMAPKYLDKFAPSIVNDPKALAQAVKGSRIAGGVIGAVPAIGGALSSGAATALSNATPEQLGQLQSDIGSDTGFAAAIMNPENRPNAPLTPERAAAKVTPTYSPDDQSAEETARLLRQNTPPELQKAAVAAAKEEIPKDTLLGFGRDDVIMFGLQLLAGKSPYAAQNVGEAGINTYAAKQAREKAALDKELVQAHKEYYSSAAAKNKADTEYMMSGARGMGAVTKAANEIFDNMMAGLSAMEKMNMSPQKRQQMQEQALAQAAKLYKIELPEGMGTPALNTTDPLGILSKKG